VPTSRPSGPTSIFSPAIWASVDPLYDPASNGNQALWLPSFLAYDFGSQAFANRLAKIDNSVLGGQYDRTLAGLGKAKGKLLVWHTWPDTITNPRQTIDWVEQQQRSDPRHHRDYLRFLQKTTGGHCAADSAQLRAGLFDWVEKGVAPKALALDAPSSGRPACEYPNVPWQPEDPTQPWRCVDAFRPVHRH